MHVAYAIIAAGRPLHIYHFNPSISIVCYQLCGAAGIYWLLLWLSKMIGDGKVFAKLDDLLLLSEELHYGDEVREDAADADTDRVNQLIG